MVTPFGAGQSGPPMGLAQYVLANSSIKFNLQNPIQTQLPHKPSILGRIFDVLSRPNYAIANMAHYVHEGRNPLTGAFRGLSGTEKETFSDVLSHDLGVKNKWVAGLGGAALDIVTDPTTFIGPGAIKSAGKAIGIGKEVGREAPELIKPLKAVEQATEETQPLMPSNGAANFLSGARQGTPAPKPVDTLESPRNLIQQASEVVPDASPKQFPEIGPISPGEEEVVDLLTSKYLKTPKTAGKLTIHPGGQLAIWKSLADNSTTALKPEGKTASAAKAIGKQRFASTLRMFKAVQENLEAAGHKFTYWDGSDFNLPDVMAELIQGKSEVQAFATAKEFFPILEKNLAKRKGLLDDPDVAQAVHNVRVRSAILDAPKIHEAINSVINHGSVLAQYPASQAHIQKVLKSLPALSEKIAAAQGISEAGQDAVKSLISGMKMTVSQEKLLTKQALAGTKQLGKEQIKTAKAIAMHHNKIEKAHRINDELTKKIQQELEIHKDDYEMPLSGKGAVPDSILGRIFAWYGQKDLRPITEQHLMTATNSAWMRDAAIRKVAQNYSREDQLSALRFAFGVNGVPESDLGRAFKANLETLFKGTGLTPADWQDASVATRAPLMKDRLNKHLKSVGAPWKFTDGVVKDPITGIAHDYSGDANWLTSWQTWDVKDPLDFFNKVQTAVEQSVHEKAIFDEIGERFGAEASGSGYRVTINHPYLHGYYFTEEIAKQIGKVIKDVDEFFSVGLRSSFLKSFDKISRAWKYTVTLPNPSHHIHNLLGDAYLNWMAGVNGAKPYQWAAQILRTQRNTYTDIRNVDRLVNLNAVERAMGRTPDAKEVLFRNASGHPFTAEQIYIAANQMGTLPQAHIIEDIMGENQNLTRFQPFGGRVKHGLERFSETREHFVRLAHFVDIVKKSKGSDFEAIFRRAGYEIRKWHPDYLTLTPFEKKFMRRIMPFYSWTRRAIPLVIESAIMNPGKTTMYPKIMQGFQDSMGIETSGRDDPFPHDQLFPEWIRDRGIGPVSRTPVLGARDTPPGYTIINPSNPLIDLFGQFSNPVSGFGSMLSPAIKIPVELLSQKQLFNQAPITSDNFAEYFGNQLPYFPVFQGIFGVTPTLGDTTRASKEGNLNTERLVNWLTAAGVRGTGPYIKQAEIEQKNGG